MPKAVDTARGGVVASRTVRLKDGRTVRIALVRKRGPRSGRPDRERQAA